MSTPKTLELDPAVRREHIDTDLGTFAALTVRGGHRGHLLLIPGWTGSKEDFAPILPLLLKAGFNATAYDQRGQYETPGSENTADYSLATWAADAAAVARAADNQPTHLLGHSLGGLVAQVAAVDYTQSWQSLSLLCSGPAGLPPAPNRPLPDFIEALENGTEMRQIVTRTKGAALAEATPEVEQFVYQKFERTSRASLIVMSQILIDTPDRTTEVAATGLPIWVGRGQDDDAWPLEQQADQATRLGTTVTVISDSAHSPAIENPTGLVAAWLGFLRGNDGRKKRDAG